MNNRPTVGIIGRGFVGKATGLLFSKSRVICYDKDETLCVPMGLTISEMVKQCNFIFICVPTPMEHETGKCSLSIIESVKKELDDSMKIINENVVKPHIFLRSTVPPTTCDKLGLNFMPEFLTEANWETDTINAKYLYFGINNIINNENEIDTIKEKLKWLITMGTSIIPSSNQTINTESSLNMRECVFGSTKGMELFKMFANSYLAMKVGFCNEIFQYTNKIGGTHIYDELCNLVKNDVRIGNTHMKVPGPDGKYGFGGTCFPKDIHSLFYEMNNLGLETPITSAVIKRNEEIDRPEKDWEKSIGRAVI